VISNPPAWLLGSWRLLHAAASIGFQPGTRMVFRPDGALSYRIPLDGSEQVVPLVYRIEARRRFTMVIHRRSDAHGAAGQA
jgi:hypothetical protein